MERDDDRSRQPQESQDGSVEFYVNEGCINPCAVATTKRGQRRPVLALICVEKRSLPCQNFIPGFIFSSDSSDNSVLLVRAPGHVSKETVRNLTGKRLPQIW